MIEKVIADGNLVALIVRRRFKKRGINFVTAKESPLQLGISWYPKNARIAPHVHRRSRKQVTVIQEVVYIAAGMLKVDLFHKNNRVATKILNRGDIILLTSGHGFKFLADTKIIEVKQGPYLNKKADKRYLRA